MRRCVTALAFVLTGCALGAPPPKAGDLLVLEVFGDWLGVAQYDGAGNEVAWHAAGRDDEQQSTLFFSCKLPVMEAVLYMWERPPWIGETEDDIDRVGLVVGNLYRREGYLEMLLTPNVVTSGASPSDGLEGRGQLVVDCRVDGKPWVMSKGIVVAANKLSLHFHPRELDFASRLSIGVREVGAATSLIDVVHRMGEGFDDAEYWVNTKCNNAPEIQRLRREWTYPAVAERMGP